MVSRRQTALSLRCDSELSLRLFAPAKLTLNLEVTGVRDNGYHELRAEMVSLDLADELFLDTSATGFTVDRSSSVATTCIPIGPENLINRALVAVGRNASVRLVKNIPVGGGLGGGSSDAAAILRWAGVCDPATALSLGSDVPFCVSGGHALVTGIGDEVLPLSYEPRSFVLLVSSFGVDTASVFAKWDQMSGVRRVLKDHVRSSEGASLMTPGNDLEDAALAVEPRLGLLRDSFASATGVTPSLAGSGSTWFVEGEMSELGVAKKEFLEIGEDRARLIEVRTTPPGWDGP